MVACGCACEKVRRDYLRHDMWDLELGDNQLCGLLVQTHPHQAHVEAELDGRLDKYQSQPTVDEQTSQMDFAMVVVVRSGHSDCYHREETFLDFDWALRMQCWYIRPGVADFRDRPAVSSSMMRLGAEEDADVVRPIADHDKGTYS